MHWMDAWDPDSEKASGHDSSLLLSIPPLLEACVGNGGTTMQCTAIKHSSCTVVLLFILSFLETVIVNITAALLLEKRLVPECLPSSMHRDQRCSFPKPNRNQEKEWAKKESKWIMSLKNYLKCSFPPDIPCTLSGSHLSVSQSVVAQAHTQHEDDCSVVRVSKKGNSCDPFLKHLLLFIPSDVSQCK